MFLMVICCKHHLLYVIAVPCELGKPGLIYKFITSFMWPLSWFYSVSWSRVTQRDPGHVELTRTGHCSVLTTTRSKTSQATRSWHCQSKDAAAWQVLIWSGMAGASCFNSSLLLHTTCPLSLLLNMSLQRGSIHGNVAIWQHGLWLRFNIRLQIKL